MVNSLYMHSLQIITGLHFLGLLIVVALGVAIGVAVGLVMLVSVLAYMKRLPCLLTNLSYNNQSLKLTSDMYN